MTSRRPALVHSPPDALVHSPSRAPSRPRARLRIIAQLGSANRDIDSAGIAARAENRLNQPVCSGDKPLAAAQHLPATDWIDAPADGGRALTS